MCKVHKLCISHVSKVKCVQSEDYVNNLFFKSTVSQVYDLGFDLKTFESVFQAFQETCFTDVSSGLALLLAYAISASFYLQQQRPQRFSNISFLFAHIAQFIEIAPWSP